MNTTDKLHITPIAPHRSLRESVTESLRSAIIAGDLVEGRMYSAPALGAAFGVSATPVREAMMDLVREGLVETVKNKGFRVTTMSDHELDEVTEIRLLLEPPTVQHLVGKIPAAGLAELHDMAVKIVDSAERKDLTGYLSADREFHAHLLSFSGNDQLVALATHLRIRTRMYGLKSLNENGQLMDSAREHLELLGLMVGGEPDKVFELMCRHLAHARGIWAQGSHPGSTFPGSLGN